MKRPPIWKHRKKYVNYFYESLSYDTDHLNVDPQSVIERIKKYHEEPAYCLGVLTNHVNFFYRYALFRYTDAYLTGDGPQMNLYQELAEELLERVLWGKQFSSDDEELYVTKLQVGVSMTLGGSFAAESRRESIINVCIEQISNILDDEVEMTIFPYIRLCGHEFIAMCHSVMNGSDLGDIQLFSESGLRAYLAERYILSSRESVGADYPEALVPAEVIAYYYLKGHDIPRSLIEADADFALLQGALDAKRSGERAYITCSKLRDGIALLCQADDMVFNLYESLEVPPLRDVLAPFFESEL
ncbi:hypothetical protein [Thaumasiovibrio subtropicus]|uniref:hypothetical protein n=1 Tax=Thaumasiovibrio subtropicus TaxID=1891207 RepID=UPI000B34BF25|nr:hypothetical protein [Thaumasiovibrio subtropicus]